MRKIEVANFMQIKRVVEPPTDKFRQRVLNTEKRTKKILLLWLVSGIFLALSACPLISSQSAHTKKLIEIIDSVQLQRISETGELIPKPLPKPQDIVFENP